ncbi:MAG: hypothetical protein GY925_05650 [Actinomycetia bacterium]|nr:hypothetical protein [Actinomycetes bacterium]
MSRVLYRLIAALARLAIRSGRSKDLEVAESPDTGPNQPRRQEDRRPEPRSAGFAGQWSDVTKWGISTDDVTVPEGK